MECVSGQSTMSLAMHDAVNYHNYTFNNVLPFLGQRVVELGCAWGLYTEKIASLNRRVLAIDLDAACIEHCQKMHMKENVTFLCADVCGPETIATIKKFAPDTVLMMQVLEHIEDDCALLDSLSSCCPAGTRIVVCVPAFPCLYGPMDREAGHFRRYTIRSLSKVLRDASWKRERAFYHNLLGGIGWLVNNRIIKKSTSLNSPKINSQILFFDKYVLPVSKCFDPFIGCFFGQTLLFTAHSLPRNTHDAN